MRNYIKNLSHHYKGNYKAIDLAFRTKTKVKEYDCYIPFITIIDSQYPACLLELEEPPYILYYLGNINLLNTPMVSIVGSRKCSVYSQRITESLVVELKKKYTLVSGLALGIDTIVHREALDFYSIGVLGCGVDICYPKQNINLYQTMRVDHLLLSEYPPQTLPHPSHFPFRNRIIAALGEKIYVMSAALRSGTMHTVDAGLKFNKQIICLPHPIDEYYGEGCNRLIQDGADVLLNTTDT